MQPTPTVSRADVERVVRRDFGPELLPQVLSILDEYVELERERVQVAVLKLANGNLDDLRRYIESAKCDWRDVLGPAEYPLYTRKMFRIDRLPEQERQKIIDSD